MNYMRSHKTEIFNDIISESLKKGSRICYSKTIIGDSEMEETYSYDKHGNLTCIRNSEGYYEEYEYDERGNIIHYTDGIVDETYEYDEYNRVTRCKSIEVYEDEFREPLSEEITIEYEYDEIGNLIKWTTSNHDVCIMEYDDLNRLSHSTTEGPSYGNRIEEFYKYTEVEEEKWNYIIFLKFLYMLHLILL